MYGDSGVELPVVRFIALNNVFGLPSMTISEIIVFMSFGKVDCVRLSDLFLKLLQVFVCFD